MNAETQNYYRLCELFDVSGPVQKALSAYLEEKMKKKVGDSYRHTVEWWRPQQGLMKRASRNLFEGSELMTFMRNGPENWGMNLILKTMKYCNHDLLTRYDTEWKALDSLIDARNTVFRASDDSRITVEAATQAFQKVQTVLGELYSTENVDDLITEMTNADSLQQKDFGAIAEIGRGFHDHLVKQKQEWEEFSKKLYERGGKPRLDQLKSFHGDKVLDVIQLMAPNFRDWGIIMLDDGGGQIVEGIRTDVSNFGNPGNIATAIINKWLGGTGMTPTWANLLECLKVASLNVLIADIEKKLL